MKKILLSLISLILIISTVSCYAADSSFEQIILNQLPKEVICLIITSVEKSDNLEKSIENFFDLRFISQEFSCFTKDKFAQKLFLSNCIDKFGQKAFQDLFDKLSKNFDKNLCKIKFLLEVICLLKKNLKDKKYFLNIDNKSISRAFIKAVRDGNIELSKILINSGAHKNIYNKHEIRISYGIRALVAACSEGHFKIAKLLINAEVNVNGGDGYRFKPLRAACFKEDVKIVELLIKAGVCVDAECDPYKSTALIDICFGGNVEIVTLLIGAGANVNLKTIYERTALLNACCRGHTEIVDLLIKANANVNASEVGGNTPLMSACLRGYTQIAKLLIVAGADINIRNNDGKTALDLTKNSEIKKILRRIMAIDKYILEDNNKYKK